ncbi:MAG: acetolactate synthase large subunit [Acidimicrobiia bacterium]|nr:acetolactate synthase large subunit [Acidimicrobiia bacterium]
MNGAQALIRTLVDAGIDVCFANPGTSEMHFVAALDDVPEMRGILGLFEGAVTGAADGYARMAGRPAATLLHLGSGLGNGLANLHNARRAATPVVNVVGDHATYHKQYDAPLDSDIESIAKGVSSWIRTPQQPDEVAADGAAAVAAAYGPPGQVATLILPADVSWGETSTGPAPAPDRQRGASVEPAAVEEVATVLRSGEPTALLVGGRVVADDSHLNAVAQVAAACGVKLLCETFPARLRRGAGRPAVERLGYLAEFAQAQLDGLAHLVVVDTKSPVSFFAYPDKASDLVPDGCAVHVLAGPNDDVGGAVAALVEAVGAGSEPLPTQGASDTPAPSGELNVETLGTALAATLPEGAIVADEGNTSGLFVAGATAGCAPHDWLCLTGGAIGIGVPLATGAAVACPDRQVLCLESDGSTMYTMQALWTQAREGLDVTTVVCNNRSYAVLNMELARVGATAGGPAARSMLDLAEPPLDFVALAQGMGVPATRATTADELVAQLRAAFAEDGPHLIEAMVPSIM